MRVTTAKSSKLRDVPQQTVSEVEDSLRKIQQNLHKYTDLLEFCKDNGLELAEMEYLLTKTRELRYNLESEVMALDTIMANLHGFCQLQKREENVEEYQDLETPEEGA